MLNAQAVLDRQFHEMRWRALSLAADFDRLQRADNSSATMTDARVSQLREALQIVAGGEAGRAERVQMLFSDQTPLPK